MSGVLGVLLGSGSDERQIDLPVSYYSWGDKYSAGEQFGADGGYFTSLVGGAFTPASWHSFHSTGSATAPSTDSSSTASANTTVTPRSCASSMQARRRAACRVLTMAVSASPQTMPD